MPRVKSLNLIIEYIGTDCFVNDVGEAKSPRFELYNQKDKKVIMKSNDPRDFDSWVKKHFWNKWKENGLINDIETDGGQND